MTVSDTRVMIGQQPPPDGGYDVARFRDYLREMEERASAMRAAGDRRSAFELTYLEFSRHVLAAMEAGRFEDSAWSSDLACRFIDAYRQQFDLWERRHPGQCRAWRAAFDAIEDGRANPMQAILLGINGHISYDLAFVTLGACRHAGDVADDPDERPLALTPAGVPVVRYRDFLLVNQLEWEAIAPVQDAVLREHSPLLYWGNRLTLRRARFLGQRMLMESRDAAWYHATLLVHLAGPEDRRLVERLIDAQAAAIADLAGALSSRPDRVIEHSVGWLRRGERLDPELQASLLDLACRNPVVAELLLRELVRGGVDPVSAAVTLMRRGETRLVGIFGRMALRFAPLRRRQRLVRFLRAGSAQAVLLLDAMLGAGLPVDVLPRGLPVGAVRRRWRAALAADRACLELPEVRADPVLRGALEASADRIASRLQATGGADAAGTAPEPAAEDPYAWLAAHPDDWVRTCAAVRLVRDSAQTHASSPPHDAAMANGGATADDSSQAHDTGEAMASTIERVLFLKDTNIFMEVDVPALIHVAARLERCTYAPGEPFVREGESIGGIYLVEQGEVQVSQSRNGEPVPVATLRSHDSVGELSVLNGSPASADCTAATPVTCWFLPSDTLSDLLHRHPRLGVGLIRVLSQRLVATTKLVADGGARLV